MKPALLGRKIGMTRSIGDDGKATPITVIQVGPCTVLQVKTSETDGYAAVQLGFEDVKPHRSTKAQIGHCGQSGAAPKRYIREVRLDSDKDVDVEVGDVLTVESMEAEDLRFVDVTGVTKGRGFQGVMKRHGFGGQPASHGTERKHRSPGSIGGHANRGLGRNVKKGKRMSGHMGDVNRTSKNHRLVSIDKDHGLILIKGSVPGPNGGFVYVRQAKTKA